jgi:hypothetical protein
MGLIIRRSGAESYDAYHNFMVTKSKASRAKPQRVRRTAIKQTPSFMIFFFASLREKKFCLDF